jgi:hypothetical protein
MAKDMIVKEKNWGFAEKQAVKKYRNYAVIICHYQFRGGRILSLRSNASQQSKFRLIPF